MSDAHRPTTARPGARPHEFPHHPDPDQRAVVAGRLLRLHRVPRPPAAAQPGARSPRTSRRSSTTTCSKAPHLERVLGVSLIALVVVRGGAARLLHLGAVPGDGGGPGFHERSVDRGATLFANAQSKDYDSTKSLLCANCHGVDGGGGTATFVVKSDDPRCDPKQPSTHATRRRPIACRRRCRGRRRTSSSRRLRYSRAQLTQIITFGRPGTPMPAWGVAVREGRAPAAEHPGPGQLRHEHRPPPRTRRRPSTPRRPQSCTGPRRVRRARAAH